PSASRAVQCGVDIVAAAAEQTARGDGPPVRVGVGVHAGETAATDEGPVGSAINIAARVCAQAGPNEILVTDIVRALTRTTLPVRFLARGSPRLKGIAEPIAVYRVEPTTAAAGSVPASASRRFRVRRSARAAGG